MSDTAAEIIVLLVIGVFFALIVFATSMFYRELQCEHDYNVFDCDIVFVPEVRE